MDKFNRSEYPAFVKTIWSEPEEHTIRGVSIAALGLIGEAGEICEQLLENNTISVAKATIDECGDVLYYATVLADWQGYDIAECWPTTIPSQVPRADAGLMLVRDCKEVSERVKKLIRDGREVDASEMRGLIRQVLISLLRILKGTGADLYDAMDTNVAKLTVRYNHVLEGAEGAHQARAKSA